MSERKASDLVWRSRAVDLVSLIISGKAILVLGSWAFEGLEFLRPVAGPPMLPTSAVLFLFVATAIFIWNRPVIHERPQFVPFVHYSQYGLGAGLLIWTGLFFVEYAFKIELGIDHLFFSDAVRLSLDSEAGRPSPSACLCFFLLALCFFFRLKRGPGALLRLFDLQVVVVAMAAYLSLAGYGFEVVVNPRQYPLSSIHAGMAIHTSVLFLLAVVALIVGTPESALHAMLLGRGFGSAVFRRFLPIAVAAPLLQGAVIHYSVSNDLLDLPMALALVGVVIAALLAAVSFWIAREVERIHRGRVEAEGVSRALELQLGAAQKMESLGAMAAGITHDFSSVLGLIVGRLSIMRTQLGDQEALKRQVDAIQRGADMGMSLMKQVVEFARVGELELDGVDMSSVVEELVEMLQGSFPTSIRIHLDLDKTLPRVTADGGRIKQVLLNLCVNARQAMGDNGELRITSGLEPGAALANRWVRSRAENYVRLSVSDTGRGIESVDLPRIFEPFYSSKGRAGTGLGLAVVYGIVQRHDGFVDVTSLPGKGATFHVFIPVSGPDGGTTVP